MRHNSHLRLSPIRGWRTAPATAAVSGNGVIALVVGWLASRRRRLGGGLLPLVVVSALGVLAEHELTATVWPAVMSAHLSRP